MRPRLRIPLLVLLFAVLAGAAACGDAVREAVELVSEGGEVELRDSLRPAAGPPRVLVLALDGVGHAALETALRQGRLPSLSNGPGGAWMAPPVVTVLPSITLAAWSTFFTGRPPAETGVPGNEWFDRRIGQFRAPAPVSVDAKEQAIAALSDGLVGDWITAPTVFELADVRSYVAMQHVHRGADLLTLASADEIGGLVEAFATGLATEEGVDREVYAVVDRASAEGAAEAVRSRGVPDFQVVYFPGVDLYTHVAENAPVEQQRYLAEVVEPAVADLLEAWREEGALDDTWILVVADHGHTSVPSDEAHALRADGPASLEAVLQSAGWRVRPPELERPDSADDQAVVALQGAFAFVYLADRSTCPDRGDRCRWPDPPLPEDVDSVAAALIEAGRAGGPLEGAVEMVIVPRRDSAGALERVERWTEDGPHPLPAASGDTVMIELRERLGWLLDGPRGVLAGDLIVMARSGGWVPEEGRFYFSHPYHSWHGSAHGGDSQAPLLVVRTDLTEEEIERRVRRLLPERPTQLDMAGLILAMLERGDTAAVR